MLLTLAQAAEKYHLSAQYLRRLAEQGKLKATKVNARLWLVDEAEVAAYAQRKEGK